MSISDISISLSSSDEEDETPSEIINIKPKKPRVSKTRTMNPLEVYSDEQFKDQYRMTKTMMMSLVNMIESKIKPFTLRNRSISALDQVLLTISYFATGAYQNAVANHTKVHRSTACRIIKKVSAAIAELGPQFISMPHTEQDRNRIKNEFYDISSFPNVIGAVGCTHIRILSPGGPQGKFYKNSEGYFSLKVQVICDAKMKILDVIHQCPGSTPESTIIDDSHIRVDFENRLYDNDFLLGDSRYPCRPYLLTPILYPSTWIDEAYNEVHMKTRSPVEKCIGVLKTRFPCLSMGLRVKLQTTMNIVVSCCVLHNLALDHNDHIDISDMESNLPEDTVVSLSTHEDTSVRSALLLTYFNR